MTLRQAVDMPQPCVGAKGNIQGPPDLGPSQTPLLTREAALQQRRRLVATRLPARLGAVLPPPRPRPAVVRRGRPGAASSDPRRATARVGGTAGQSVFADWSGFNVQVILKHLGGRGPAVINEEPRKLHLMRFHLKEPEMRCILREKGMDEVRRPCLAAPRYPRDSLHQSTSAI